jgi:hypothetical protein
MVPQFKQGFLQPEATVRTGKPQRSHVGMAGALWAGGQRGGGAVAVLRFSTLSRRSGMLCRPAAPLPRSPAALPKSVRSRQERIGEPFHTDRSVRAVTAMDNGGIRE